MEPIAVGEFIKYFKKHHKDVRCGECGIFIDKTKQYLIASPDLLIECSFCGEAVVEIKNSFSIANEIPSVDNLPYLCMCNGQVALKQQHHQYFAQVQGEMAQVQGEEAHVLFLCIHTKGLLPGNNQI